MKQIRWIGISLFAVLGILSVVLYKERVLYVDSAYYAFNLFNKGFPNAEHNRFALYLYQLIPWGMFELNMPMSLTLRVYSLCHILLHAIAFLLLLKWKQPKMAGLLVIMQIIGYRECFFLAVNETALAISATSLLAGYLNYIQIKATRKLHDILVFSACLMIGLFSHPMAMIMIPFVIGYHIIEFKWSRKIRSNIYALMVIALLVFILKKMVSNGSGYEDDLFAQLHNTKNILYNLSDVYSFKFFTGEFKLEAYFFKIYWIPLLIVVFNLLMLYRLNKPVLLTYYILSTVSLWLIIIIFFNRGDGNIFMEKNYTPWIFVALYPLVTVIQLKGEHLQLKHSIAHVGILLFSLWGIYNIKDMYSKRLYLMDQLITVKNPGKSKLLINDSLVNHEEWLGVWALPYETLLLSKVKGIPDVTAKIYKGEPNIEKEIYRKDIFLGADFIPVLPASFLLNQEVYHLKDEPYYKIEKFK